MSHASILENKPFLDLHVLSRFVLVTVKKTFNLVFHLDEQGFYVFQLDVVGNFAQLDKTLTALLATVSVLLAVITTLLLSVVLLVMRRLDQGDIFIFTEGHVFFAVVDPRHAVVCLLKLLKLERAHLAEPDPLCAAAVLLFDCLCFQLVHPLFMVIFLLLLNQGLLHGNQIIFVEFLVFAVVSCLWLYQGLEDIGNLKFSELRRI